MLDVFGPERIMFGSDWPLMKLAHVSFQQVFDLANQMVDKCSIEDKQKIFHTNAIEFYNLKM